MYKRAFAMILATLMSGGCNKALALPTGPEAVVVRAEAQVCQAFSLVAMEPHDSPNMATPYTRILITKAGLQDVILEEREGNGPWVSREYPINGDLYSTWSKGVELDFNRQYRIKGIVGGCESEWFHFKIGPQNSDSSSQSSGWRSGTCVEFSFSPGKTLVLPVSASNALLVTTYDHNHKIGYQPGQVETLEVVGVGVTHDIPNSVISVATPFTLHAPVNHVTLVGKAGSINEVCVSGK